MENFVGDIYGLIHLISSTVALVSGTMVLFMKKGTTRHKQAGYVYVISMILLLLTGLMIYRLFNGWGIFHYTSIISLLTIFLGMIPIWTRKPARNWKIRHFTFMYWSVMGLYSAFVAEVITRVPGAPFFGVVGISFIIIMLAGGVFFRVNKSKWLALSGAGNKKQNAAKA